MLYQKNGKPVRVVLIATARPAQGGTTTAVNLALALAEVGQRVVLIDCDLRRPSLHRLFGQENGYGLADLLRGGTDYDWALRATEAPSLRLLAAGSESKDPAALLNSGAMGQLLSTIRAEADYVVIDGPSLGAFADSMMLAPLVDGVLIVARANQSMGTVEAQAKEMLERVGANIIGAVLNGASPDRVANVTSTRTITAPPPLPTRVRVWGRRSLRRRPRRPPAGRTRGAAIYGISSWGCWVRAWSSGCSSSGSEPGDGTGPRLRRGWKRKPMPSRWLRRCASRRRCG